MDLGPKAEMRETRTSGFPVDEQRSELGLELPEDNLFRNGDRKKRAGYLPVCHFARGFVGSAHGSPFSADHPIRLSSSIPNSVHILEQNPFGPHDRRVSWSGCRRGRPRERVYDLSTGRQEGKKTTTYFACLRGQGVITCRDGTDWRCECMDESR